MICDRCGVRWGHKPGCSWPQNDDDENDDYKKYHDESDENRTDDYDEASNPVVHQQAAHDKQIERQSLINAEASPAPLMGAVPEETDTGPAVMVLDDTPDEMLDLAPDEEVPVGSKPTEALL